MRRTNPLSVATAYVIEFRLMSVQLIDSSCQKQNIARWNRGSAASWPVQPKRGDSGAAVSGDRAGRMTMTRIPAIAVQQSFAPTPNRRCRRMGRQGP
jgi:hypothetical protein